MSVIELSVFVENKHGRIADIANILGENNISICGFDIAHTPNGYGIFRFIVKEVDKAVNLLSEKGFTVREREIIAIQMEHKSNVLSGILKIFAKEDINININYIYVAANNVLCVSTSDNDKALIALKKNGGNILEQGQL